jgi:hypothetical protein
MQEFVESLAQNTLILPANTELYYYPVESQPGYFTLELEKIHGNTVDVSAGDFS